jgi:hypothetical protein
VFLRFSVPFLLIVCHCSVELGDMGCVVDLSWEVGNWVVLSLDCSTVGKSHWE